MRLSECGEEEEEEGGGGPAWDRHGIGMDHSPRGVIFSCPETERLSVRHLRRS